MKISMLNERSACGPRCRARPDRGLFALRLAFAALFAAALNMVFISRSIAAGDKSHPSIVDLQANLEKLAHSARPGTLGVAVLDLESGRRWQVNANEAYPMMSVFKAPLGAAVLSEVEAGNLSLDRKITVTRTDLRPGASFIGKHFKGESMVFTVKQLLGYAVSKSDNTAADKLLSLAGGGEAVTKFLQAHGIEGMRIDIGEGEVAHIFSGLGDVKDAPSVETAAVRQKRLEQGYKAFLADPRNRSTPGAAVAFLRKLWEGQLLSPKSTEYLLDLMHGQTVPKRLAAGLPSNIRFAHKSGTSMTIGGKTAAFNDIGVVTWPGGKSVIIAAFLTASNASRANRDALFAELARDIVAALRP
ncbi:MAG TPA: class A beta-lactamase [Rhizobiaceae bacterium]|nr:class A beta-lactamase [Rhizobiaceae bacterium]